MSWVNDVGGMHGFGRVPVGSGAGAPKPLWAARMWAVNQILIARGLYNFDHYRHAVERIPPARYLSSTSDERQLMAVETLIRERLSRGSAGSPGTAPERGCSAGQGERRPPRFAVGTAVVVRPDAPETHTRTPRYVRGRPGVVQAVRGWALRPEDRVADDPQATAEPVYSVCFEASQLWGAQATRGGRVFLDLWESHLDSSG